MGKQDEPLINGLDAAIILRTYYALIESDPESRFLSFYKDSQRDWREEKTYKAAINNAKSKVISDTAIRLFYISFLAECRNADPSYGYGFHYLFRLSTVSAIRLYLKTIDTVFSGNNMEECLLRIQTALDLLSDL